MRKRTKTLITIVAAAMAIPALFGCSDKSFSQWAADVENGWNDFVNDLDDTGDKIKDGLDDAGQTIKDGIEDAGQNIQDGWNDFADNVKDTVDNISQGAQSFGNQVGEWFTQTYQNASNVTRDVTNKIKDFTVDTATKIGDFCIDTKDRIMSMSFTPDSFGKFTIRDAARYDVDLTEEYYNDIETFVYSLVFHEFSKIYRTFVAKATNPLTNEEVLGIAVEGEFDSELIDDGNCQYFYDEEDNVYSIVGFVQEAGATPFTEEELRQGIDVVNAGDTDDDMVNYIIGLDIPDFTSHFVRQNKYVVFGIKNDVIFFDQYDYSLLACYENGKIEYGGLYNYDNQEWIDTDYFGNANEHITTDGSLLTGANTVGLELSTSEIIEKMRQTKFSFSFDHFSNMLSNIGSLLQSVKSNIEENTFLGYNMADILNKTGAFNESDVLKAADNQFNISPIPENPDATVSQTTKTVLIVVAVILTILTLFVSLFMRAYPWIGSIFSALSAVAVYIAFEICNGKNFTQLNWTKIIITAIAGALAPFLGKVSGSLVAALTSTIFTMMDGNSLLGGGLTFMFTFIVSIIIANVFEKIAKFIDKKIPKIGEFIDNHQITFGRKKLTAAQGRILRPEELDDNASRKLFNKQVKQMVSDKNPNFNKVDANGNILTKTQIKNGSIKNFDVTLSADASDDVLQAFAQYGFEPGDVVMTYNDALPSMKYSVSEIDIPEGIIGTNRNTTFATGDEYLASYYRNNPDLIPDDVMDAITVNNMSVDRLSSTDISKIRSGFGTGNKFTWHEVNGTHLQLVPSELHGLISHMGGHATMKFLIAYSNVQRLVMPTF
ncbi:MAG: HNH endonuclease [Bacilli bacterium]|nr:HNH endonuclease [Bacilli bacterium]